MTPMVKAQEVCKSFGALHYLKGITLEVGRGEVTCMVGPPGRASRRSCAAINHLEQVNAGRLYVDGDLIGLSPRPAPSSTRSHPASAKTAPRNRRSFSTSTFPARTALANVHRGTCPGSRASKRPKRWRGDKEICWNSSGLRG